MSLNRLIEIMDGYAGCNPNAEFVLGPESETLSNLTGQQIEPGLIKVGRFNSLVEGIRQAELRKSILPAEPQAETKEEPATEPKPKKKATEQ